MTIVLLLPAMRAGAAARAIDGGPLPAAKARNCTRFGLEQEPVPRTSSGISRYEGKIVESIEIPGMPQRDREHLLELLPQKTGEALGRENVGSRGITQILRLGLLGVGFDFLQMGVQPRKVLGTQREAVLAQWVSTVRETVRDRLTATELQRQLGFAPLLMVPIVPHAQCLSFGHRQMTEPQID